MGPAQTLDPATLQALTWVFGSLLFLLLSTMCWQLYTVIRDLSKAKIEHELRITNLEDDMETVHENLFPVKYRSKNKR